MKKKLSSLFIALALCLTMAQPALARETGESPKLITAPGFRNSTKMNPRKTCLPSATTSMTQ